MTDNFRKIGSLNGKKKYLLKELGFKSINEEKYNKKLKTKKCMN
jgi:hypothetical protein